MSEQEQNVQTEQAAPPAQENPPPAAASEAPAEAAALTVEAQKAALAASEGAKRDELAKVLKHCVTAFRKGETEYRKGLLLSGELAHVYVTGRLALGDERKPALDTITGQLSAYSSTTVRVDELIAVWASYDLLHVQTGQTAEPLPYGHYREGFRELVRRVNPGKRGESWELLPHVSDESRDLYEATLRDSLSREAVIGKCQELKRRQARADEDAKTAASKAAREKEEQAKRDRDEAERVKLRAEGQAKEAEAAAKAAQDEDSRQELTSKAQEAHEAVRAAQQAHAETVTRQEQAARDAAQKEADAKRAKEAADKLAQKELDRAARKAGQTASKPADARQGQNLLATGKAGTAKDVAEMARELVMSNDNPDATLAFLMQALDGQNVFSKPVLYAIKAFRLSLNSALNRTSERPAAAAPEANGTAPEAPASAPAA